MTTIEDTVEEIEEIEEIEEVAEEQEPTEDNFSYDDGVSGFNISLGDVLDFLKTIPDKSVDMILTDPPYESLEKHRMIGSKKRLRKWFSVIPNATFELIFKEFDRVLKNNSHLYVMCDQETMFIFKPLGEDAGFKFWKPIIWDKVNIGLGWHYRARYEMIMFFEKGKRKLLNMGQSDVISVKKIHNGYPTEKPVELLKVLIENSTVPGQVVLDPFMGSGSCGEACLRTGRRFIGNDISNVSYGLVKGRLTSVADEVRAASAPTSPTTFNIDSPNTEEGDINED